MNPDVERLLSDKPAIQVEWVFARVVSKTDEEAAQIIGVHRTTPPGKWKNIAELRRAVELIRHERAMKNIEAVCYQLPEEIRKTTKELREIALGARARLVPLALEGLEAKLKQGKRTPMEAIHMVLDFCFAIPDETSDVKKIVIEYDNDWRENPFAESAPGPDDSEATSQALQLVECGPEMAKNDNGNVNRG